jgi:maltose phosphorylase
MATKNESVAENLLYYRYKHLEKAIENAGKLGFNKGAALYPMVTMNGEECHNEWEITFEEIHRNAAIAYAIYRYECYSGKKDYVENKGIDVLVGIARFWAQRMSFSNRQKPVCYFRCHWTK